MRSPASRALPALVVALCCAALRPHALAAQALRTDSIAQAEAAKAESLGVEGRSELESLWVRFRKWRQSPLYPDAQFIYPGAGPGVGLGYVGRWPESTRGVRIAGDVGLRRSGFLAAELQAPELAGGRIDLALNARHTMASDLEFYGLGRRSSLAESQDYDYRPTSLGATGSFHPVPWINLSARYERLILRSTADSGPPPGGAPGLGRDLSYSVVQGTAALDWRPSPGYDTRGGLQQLTLSRYLETQGLPYGFSQLEYEGIQLLPILREQWVLAFHVLATLTTAEPGDSVPAVLTPTLGGAESLRGFRTRRFTDLDRVLASAEYRWRPSRYVDMALFADAGRVASRRSDLDLSHLEKDWGLGIRIHGDQVQGTGLGVGKSREGWKVFLTGGTRF